MYPGTNVPDKIIVHHTAYAPNVYQYPLVNEWHKGRDFPLSTLGSYVGYHYLIEKDGSYTQARAETEGGAHTKGQNFTSIGICLAGDFNNQLPTVNQTITLSRLIHAIRERIPSIPITSIYPHRKFNQTECYGTNLDDNWVVSIAQRTYNDQIGALQLDEVSPN